MTVRSSGPFPLLQESDDDWTLTAGWYLLEAAKWAVVLAAGLVLSPLHCVKRLLGRS